MNVAKSNERTNIAVIALIAGGALFLVLLLLVGLSGNNGTMTMGSGITVSGVLLFLVKVLLVVFIAGLGVGVLFEGKRLFDAQRQANTSPTATTASSSAESVPTDNDSVEKAAAEGTLTCSVCGKELASQWGYCPFCGAGRKTEVEDLKQDV